MTSIVDTPRETKERLLDALCNIDQDRMRIIGVGNSCPEEGTVYLHMASTTRFRQQKNGNIPIQYCGWFYLDHLNIETVN